MSRRQSESVKVRVERLVAAQLTGHAVDDETARWISDLDRQMAEKLARFGGRSEPLDENNLETPGIAMIVCQVLGRPKLGIKVNGHSSREVKPVTHIPCPVQ